MDQSGFEPEAPTSLESYYARVMLYQAELLAHASRDGCVMIINVFF